MKLFFVLAGLVAILLLDLWVIGACGYGPVYQRRMNRVKSDLSDYEHACDLGDRLLRDEADQKFSHDVVHLTEYDSEMELTAIWNARILYNCDSAR